MALKENEVQEMCYFLFVRILMRFFAFGSNKWLSWITISSFSSKTSRTSFKVKVMWYQKYLISVQRTDLSCPVRFCLILASPSTKRSWSYVLAISLGTPKLPSLLYRYMTSSHCLSFLLWWKSTALCCFCLPSVHYPRRQCMVESIKLPLSISYANCQKHISHYMWFAPNRVKSVPRLL